MSESGSWAAHLSVFVPCPRCTVDVLMSKFGTAWRITRQLQHTASKIFASDVSMIKVQITHGYTMGLKSPLHTVAWDPHSLGRTGDCAD